MAKKKIAPEGMRYCKLCEQEGGDGFRPLNEFYGPFTDPRYSEPRYSDKCKRHEQAARVARREAKKAAGTYVVTEQQKQQKRDAAKRFAQRYPAKRAALRRAWRERNPERSRRENAEWQKRNAVYHSMRQQVWRARKQAKASGLEMPRSVNPLHGRKPLRAYAYDPTRKDASDAKE